MTTLQPFPISPIGTLYKDVAVPAVNGLGQEVQVRKPDFQIKIQQFVSSTSTIPLSNIPNNILASQSPQPAILQAGTSTRINDVQIRLTLNLSGGPVTFVPTTYWFQRLDITQTSGNPMPLASMYVDTQHAWLQTCVPQSDLLGKMKLMNYNVSKNGFMNNPQYPTINQSGDYNFYYYCSQTFINQYLAILWASAQTNLIFQFTPDASIIVSGTGTYFVKSISVVLQSQNLIARDLAMEIADSNNLPSSTQYLDPIQVRTGLATSITAGQQFTVDCSNITGRMAFLAIYIRLQGSNNTNFGYLQNCCSIGCSSGTIDFTDASGTSLVSNNSPWYSDYAQYEIANDQSLNDSISRAPTSYIIPFTDNIPAAFKGKEQGFLYQTNNTHNRLSVVSVAPVAEVYTITTGGALTSGFYRFYIESKGDLSCCNGTAGTYGSLPYNATTAQMATALSSMNSLIGQGVRFGMITISGALNSGSSITISIAYPRGNGLQGDTIQIVPDYLTVSGTQVSPTSACTTPGISGLATGVYDIWIYAWVYREMVMANGVLSMQIQSLPTYPPPEKALSLTAVQVIPPSEIVASA